MQYETEAGQLEEMIEDLPVVKAGFWHEPEFWRLVSVEVVGGIILVLVLWFLVRVGGIKLVGGRVGT